MADSPAAAHQPAAALVLDAHIKSSLSTIRSLGRRGIPVIAGSHRPSAMGFYSRYARERFLYPSPLDDRAAFAARVREIANRAGNPVLFAFSDSTLLPLVPSKRARINRAAPAWNCLLPSSLDCFDVAFDKGRTLKLADSVGIEGPATYAEPSAEWLPDFLERNRFPLVVKPRRSVYWNCAGNPDRGVQVTATFATSAEDLKTKCAALLAQTGEFPLVQECVSGEEASVQFLCDHGEIIGACANRRLRSINPTGGPGALKETIPLSYGGMAERGHRLASVLNWTGPMMVEFKIDRHSGVPKLMEINGRFWGSLPLAIFAGVDFPYLYYRLAQGDPVEAVDSYREVVSRHFVGDLHNLFSVWFKRDPLRAGAFPTRVQALHDFLILPRGCKSDVLDRLDILPAVAEMIDTGAGIFSRSGLFSRSTPAAEPGRARDAARSEGQVLGKKQKSFG